MTDRQPRSIACIQSRRLQSGVSLVEFACVALMLIVMVFGVIDFSRAIYQKQVLTHLSREGSNIASRYTDTDLTPAAQAVIDGSAPLDLNQNGFVIVSAITNDAGTCHITSQVSMGKHSTTSRIGNTNSKTLNLPQPCAATGTGVPQNGQTLYATEVFYEYQPVTPIGSLLRITIPSTLYDVAYF